MDTNKISILTFALSCLVAFALFSCSRGDLPPADNNEHGYIIATLNTAQTRNPLEATNDDVVRSVRIFVFVDEMLETQQLFRHGEAGWNNPFRMEVVLGQKNIFVVANETAEMQTALEKVLTVRDLYNVIAAETAINQPFVFDVNDGLPMTGRIEDVSVVANTVTSTTVTLTHLTAKLSINIIDGAQFDYPIEISRITLRNNMGRSLLWERSDGAFLAFDEDDFFNYEITGFSRDNNRWRIPPLYLFENLHGYNHRLFATRLEIEALLPLREQDGTGYVVRRFPVTYSVYINARVGSLSDVVSDDPRYEEHLYRIRRGHHYILTGTISGSENTHIAVKTNVRPWVVVESEKPLF